MQDIHSLTRGAPPTEHLYAAAAAVAGDRRLLRPTNQALKCPRCDSLNTKFCYYNNYNLSQPRHFCKSCRRYWTKGGVLRNVPVGGGCRKSKRSSTSSSSSNSKSSLSKPPHSPSLFGAKSQPCNDAAVAVTYNNINNSSSDGSVIAAAASPIIPADIPTLFLEYGASCMEKPATTAATSLYGIEDITIDHHHDGGRDDVSAGMLTEIRNFPSLIGSTSEIGPFGYGGLMSQHDHHHRQPQDRVVVDGFGPLDWEGSGGDSNGGDRGEELFDVTGAVDHAYWSQLNQWTAADDVVDHHHQGQVKEWSVLSGLASAPSAHIHNEGTTGDARCRIKVPNVFLIARCSRELVVVNRSHMMN